MRLPHENEFRFCCDTTFEQPAIRFRQPVTAIEQLTGIDRTRHRDKLRGADRSTACPDSRFLIDSGSGFPEYANWILLRYEQNTDLT
jgi:hypothetical protein